ncbi:MAG: DHH family phosphoesterase [Candidatus Hadarchaeales archaeon]
MTPLEKAARLLLEKAREGRCVLLVSHQQADPDGVGSAVVLSEVLEELGARTEVVVPEGMNKLAQFLLERYGREVSTSPNLQADLVVMVDASSFSHLGKVGEEVRRKPVLLIDHHLEVEGMKEEVEVAWVDEHATSSAEMILHLLREMGKEPSAEQANLLLAGILTDTAGLKLARNSTLEAVCGLIRCGADYRQLLETLKLPEDRSRRMAMLKAAQRMEIRSMGEHLVVFSELSAFEADAASVLLRLGADLSFVGSEEKGEFRISGRATPELCESTQLHLGSLMQEVGRSFGGSGGGHPGAASATGRGSLREVRRFILSQLEKTLTSKE